MPSTAARRTAAPLAALFLIASWSPQAQSQQAPPSWVSQAPANGTLVRLLNPGIGAPQPLRLAPIPGSTQSLTMTVTMSLAMAMSGMAVPSPGMPIQTYDMVVTVDDVSTSGITYGMAIVDIRVSEAPGMMPGMVDAMGEALAGIEGMSGKVRVTDRGEVIESRFALPAGAPPQLADQLIQLEKNTGNMSLPMPAEAVAVGAQWEVLRRNEINGMAVSERHLITLKSRTDDSIELETLIEQAVDGNDITPPGMPPGTQVELLSLTSRGAATQSWRLTEVVPHSGTSAMAMEMAMHMSADSLGEHEVLMDMTVQVDVAETTTGQ